MVPVVLDPGRVRFALVGGGEQALSRLRMLKAHGASPKAVYAPRASAPFAGEAGEALVPRLPSRAEIADVDVVFVGDLDRQEAAGIVRDARAVKTLVNVLDVREESDIHVPASVRRGALLVTVSTDGASPGLARRLAAYLGEKFGAEWSARVEEIARARQGWRAQGMSMQELARATDRFVEEKGWLT